MPTIPSLAVRMQSQLLRSWNCNGIQTAMNIPASGEAMAVAWEANSTGFKLLQSGDELPWQQTRTSLIESPLMPKPHVMCGSVASRKAGKEPCQKNCRTLQFQVSVWAMTWQLSVTGSGKWHLFRWAPLSQCHDNKSTSLHPSWRQEHPTMAQ